ncbi:MAG: hypothetical protein JWN30_2799 [Bacilli bacterium]|nr:hypothetical protein [Bacilli bacterium]
MQNSLLSGIRLWIVLILCVFGLTGCWDVNEVNDIGIMIAGAVDAAPQGKIRFSAQIALPSQAGPETGPSSTTTGKSTFVLSSVAGDLHAAESEMQMKLSRRLFLAHRDLILIGESMAKRGLDHLLDEPIRNPQSRLRTYVAVTKGEALQYLNVTYPFERVPSEGIRKIVFGGVVTDFDTDVSRFAYMLTTPGTNAMMPIVRLKPPVPGESPKFELDGLAVFRGTRMIGQLSDQQGRDVLWLRGETTRGTATFSIPGRRGYVSCELLHQKTSFNVDLKQGHPIVQIRYKVINDVVENTTMIDLSRSENVELVQKTLADHVRSNLLRTLLVLQKHYDADVAGLGERVYRAHPEQWPKSRLAGEWDKEFRNLPVTIEVDANVRRVGMTRRSLTSQSKQLD